MHYIFNKVHISKYIKGLENGEKVPLSIITIGNPLDVLRLLERTQTITGTTDQHLTEYFLLHKTLKKRLRKYGVITTIVFVLTFLLIT